MRNTIWTALVVVALAMAPAAAFAGGEAHPVTPKGSIGAGLSVGFTTWDKSFNKDGDKGDAAKDATTEIPITVGASYGVIDNLDVGVELSLLSTSVGDKSGFGLRELGLGVGYDLPVGDALIHFNGGFNIDMGSKPEPTETDKMRTSDGQNTIKLGAHYLGAMGTNLKLTAGANVLLHMENDDKVKSGMLIDPNVGLGYELNNKFSVGAVVGYAMQGKTEAAGTEMPDSDGNLLYIMPWLHYATCSVSGFWLALGSDWEDVMAGYPLIGKNWRANAIPGITAGYYRAF